MNRGVDSVENGVWLGVTSQDGPPQNPHRPGIVPVTENYGKDALGRLSSPCLAA